MPYDIRLTHVVVSNQPGLASIKEELGVDLVILSRWFRSNGLKLHLTNTEFIIIGTSKQTKKSEEFKATMSGALLKPPGILLILGVTIDNNLSWQTQTAKTIGRRYNGLIARKKTSHVFPKRTFKYLIQTLRLTCGSYIRKF